MPGMKDVTNLWNNVREIDLRPLSEAALRGVRIAIVGRAGTGRHVLAEQMRRDPARPGVETQSPLLILEPDAARAEPGRLATADLIILTLHALAEDDDLERLLVKSWIDRGNKVLVVITRTGDAPAGSDRTYGVTLDHWIDTNRVVIGRMDDPLFLQKEFSPQVIDLLPDLHLALGRAFPLFRVPIAHQLINETSFSNAAYSLSTGMAEVIPVLGLPLTVADMVVLTKSQAFLVYKLGLALGLSTRWQDYVAEFGGVLGGGFVWRQVARSLIGLIPAWGIVPKVAIAYSGTYVVGNVVLQWYLTGRHVDKQQMRQLYAEAYERGKRLAQRLPHPRLGRPRFGRRRRQPPALPAGTEPHTPASEGRVLEVPASLPPVGPADALQATAALRQCSNCGKTSAPDASFCQYCGTSFPAPGAPASS